LHDQKKKVLHVDLSVAVTVVDHEVVSVVTEEAEEALAVAIEVASVVAIDEVVGNPALRITLNNFLLK
jgi:hypothetical protein